MSFSYDCERPSGGRVNLRFRGEIARDDIAAVHEEVESILAQVDGPVDVLFDFTAADKFETSTRHPFLELQKLLRSSEGRTAYIADRPRIRGIALWVIHHANDGRAKVLGRVQQAETWFEQDVGRLDEAKTKGEKLVEHLASVRRLVR